MSIEQAQPSRRCSPAGGQKALLNAIRGSGRGRIRLGGLEYPVDLVVAEKTKDAMRYFVVTGAPAQVRGGQRGPGRRSNHPFTVFVFDVPGFGTGDGNDLHQAALSIDDEGHVRAEQYEGDPARSTTSSG